MEPVNTNLNTRIEERYVVQNSNKYVDRLRQQNFKEEKYSENYVTLTVYLNVPNDPLPFNSSIRIRKYMHKKVSQVALSLGEEFFFEVKTTTELTKKSKDRFTGTLSEILEYARTKYHPDIQPILALQYERSHYIHENGNGDIRVTIDSPVDFFMFPDKSLCADYIGSETNGTRLEVKAHTKQLIEEFLPADAKRFPILSTYTPSLDISTSGKTKKEVQKKFAALVSLFLEEIFEAGTAKNVLSELGWTKHEKRWNPPEVVSSKSVGIRVPAMA